MRSDKKTKLLAKQLFRLSLVDGVVSPGQVAAVLAYIDRSVPHQTLALLRLYHRAIAAELAKSHAVVEHAGAVSPATLEAIAAALTRRYQRPITVAAQPNPQLLAGLRVRVGSDILESTVAGQLAALSSAL